MLNFCTEISSILSSYSGPVFPPDLIETSSVSRTNKSDVFYFSFCGLDFKLNRSSANDCTEYIVLSLYSSVEDDYTVVFVSHR